MSLCWGSLVVQVLGGIDRFECLRVDSGSELSPVVGVDVAAMIEMWFVFAVDACAFTSVTPKYCLYQ